MKIFLDTSSLFKLYHRESGTEELMNLFNEIDSDIKPDDMVEIYVWNNSRKTMRIDDFRIEVQDINSNSNF